MFKITYKLLFFLYLAFSCFSATAAQINIVCLLNGYGVEKDYEILKDALTDLGHEVRHVSYRGRKAHCPSADINIFIEQINKDFFRKAQANYFIPNPEWSPFEDKLLKKCDLILCRTKEAERIYSGIANCTYYLGFTSEDHFDPSVAKSYCLPLHVGGGSRFKGTQTVLEAWSRRSDFPELLFIENRRDSAFSATNVQWVHAYLPDQEFVELQNAYGVHICPSQVEGYGHYIMEAMSTGAVVLTTDGAPMNEMIQDARFLVKSMRTEKKRLANLYFPDSHDLEEKFSRLMWMDEEELKEIGRANRQLYLALKAEFHEQLKELFGEVH